VSNLIIRIVGEIKLIDLSGGEGRFLQLKLLKSRNLEYLYSMGFLPNGDLIIVAVGKDRHNKLKDYKIFKYSFINKPTNATPWEYSQTHDIHVENLNIHDNTCIIYKTKLFLVSEDLMVQWDLLKMAFEMQYNLLYHNYSYEYYCDHIVTNKNQTLLALYTYLYKKIDVYSMETGMWISRYG
jgi:hypothetical protein